MIFQKVPHCITRCRGAVFSFWVLLCLSAFVSQTLAGVTSEDVCGCAMPHSRAAFAQHQAAPCCEDLSGHSCCHLEKKIPLDAPEAVFLSASPLERLLSFELVEGECDISSLTRFPQAERMSCRVPVARSAPIYLQHRTFLC